MLWCRLLESLILRKIGTLASFFRCAGAQSVVLSGGYEDDVDEGEYFLYTGSGGKV